MLLHTTKPSKVHTDASAVGVGAGLIQKADEQENPIAKASKSLNEPQGNYGATELELLAVVFAVEKFQYYFEGAMSFKKVTDHAAISPFSKPKN